MTALKNENKLEPILGLIIIIVLFVSCSSIEIKDATIKIKPYNENDRGKFWHICIDYESIGFSDKPVAFFEIHDKEGLVKEYSINFIHLKQKCNNKNVLVSFTHRHTPHEEWEWLKTLNYDGIEYVKVKVKRNWEDIDYVFEKKIMSEDLK